MELDPSAHSADELYQHLTRLITPRPIAWVSTESDQGVTNLAPYSYFNAIGSNPPTCLFCPANRPDGTKKHTLFNVEQNGEFVVNIVSHDLAEIMNQTSANYDSEVSEFQACGIAASASTKVRPPRVAEAKAHIECQLHSAIQLGAGPGGANLVIGRIVAIHISDDVLDDDGLADPAALDTVGRLGGYSYSRTTDRFNMDRPKV